MRFDKFLFLLVFVFVGLNINLNFQSLRDGSKQGLMNDSFGLTNDKRKRTRKDV
jgi:hypothetical protein